MAKKKKPVKPFEIPAPAKRPEIEPSVDPEEPLIPAEDPDIIPYEDPDEPVPDELPAPGEGP